MLNDKTSISGNVSAVEGSVSIDYFDTVTGKVKERIVGGNHVFGDSFQCSSWSNVLTQSARASLFLTDDGTYPNDRFPYLRGTILGWGQVNAGANGTRQGSYVGAESWLNRDEKEGRGRSWRYTYEFGASQVPESVRCVGITPQYRPFLHNAANPVDMFALRPLRERSMAAWPTAPVSIINQPAVIRGSKRYSLHSTAATAAGIVTVMVFDLITGVSKNITVTEHFTALGGNQTRAIGMSFDSPKAYLMMISGTVNNRRVLEFANDSFTTLLNTYTVSNISSSPTGNNFAVLGDTMYQASHSGLSIANFRENTNWNIVTAIEPCPFNVAASAGHRFITIKDGLFWTHGIPGTAAGRHPVFDIGTKKQVATIAPFNGNTLGICTEPSLDNRMFLYLVIGTHGSLVYDYWTNQALAAYVISDDAPPRPPGTGMKISYQIDATY